MKARRVTKCLTIFLVLAIALLAMPFFVTPQSALAEDFSAETRQDEYFSLSMTAKSRQNTPLPLVTQQDAEGKVTYLCFQWRDLQYLQFHISAAATAPKYGSYHFVVTHKQSETLSALLDAKEESLYDGTLDDSALGKNRILDLFYNIDSVVAEELNPTTFAGKDYGLYRFDFVYSREVEGEFKDVSLGDSIYVAILPDRNIKEIMQNNSIQIVHSVSSSNRLINVFHLSFSNPDALRYVNPDLITWVAYGKGSDNIEYCLTEEMKMLDVELANCAPIYENFSIHGTNFLLDTREIEGTWQAYAIVKDYDGEEFRLPTTEELSTIKVPPKNYVWLILLIVGIVLFVLFLIAILVLMLMKKREKIW